MPQPTAYAPTHDFSVDIVPGDLGNALDEEFDDLQLTTDEIRANQALLQRDDGAQANATIHPDAFTAASLALIASDWTPRGLWLTATLYAVGDLVEESGAAYVCSEAHTSGTFATDHTAGKWIGFSQSDALTTAFSLTLLAQANAAGWFTGLGISAFVQTLLNDATASDFMTTLGFTALGKTLIALASASAGRSAVGLNAQVIWAGTAGGTADALTLTPTPAAEGLSAGLTVFFKSGAGANAGATTLAVSGLAATAVQSNGAACVGGEIEASRWYMATYDGAAFQLSRYAPAVLLDLFTAKGDIVAATADGKVARVAAGNYGSVPMYDSTQSAGLRSHVFKQLISGLLVTNNAGDAANDLDISIGEASDSTNLYFMRLTSAFTKRFDATFATGTGNGGMAAGESMPAAGRVNVWLIMKGDGTVDVFGNNHATTGLAPTLPTDFLYKRLIGSRVTVGTAFISVSVKETAGGGEDVTLNVFTNQINLAATLTTSRRSDSLVTIPLGYKVKARMIVRAVDASTWAIYVSDPDSTDVAPSITGTAPHGQLFAAGGSAEQKEITCWTDTSGQIGSRGSLATIDTYLVCPLGWEWSRRI